MWRQNEDYITIPLHKVYVLYIWRYTSLFLTPFIPIVSGSTYKRFGFAFFKFFYFFENVSMSLRWRFQVNLKQKPKIYKRACIIVEILQLLQHKLFYVFFSFFIFIFFFRFNLAMMMMMVVHVALNLNCDFVKYI